jgi:hypothetical protein
VAIAVVEVATIVESTGQLVTVGAQFVIVTFVVVDTVELNDGVDEVGTIAVTVAASASARREAGIIHGRMKREEARGNTVTNDVVRENSNIFANVLAGKLEEAQRPGCRCGGNDFRK